VRRRESSWRVVEGQVGRVREDSWEVEVWGRDVRLLWISCGRGMGRRVARRGTVGAERRQGGDEAETYEGNAPAR
jgi:hypothetical protein